MRNRFQQQLEFGITPISEVELDFKSRHSLVPILRGLQYVFETPEMNSKIFDLLEKKVLAGKEQTGRWGMSLWEILVLGTVKLNLDADYDELHDLTNEHGALRGILGIQRSDFRVGQKYSLQSIKDNVRLLDEATIMEIVEIIAKGGHELVKKKEGKASLDLEIRADSFVVEANIHFPTDLNLLWDSARKSIETIGYFRQEQIALTQWREWKDWRKKVKLAYRDSSEIHRKKGANYKERLQESVNSYLEIGRTVSEKVRGALLELSVAQDFVRVFTNKEQQRWNDLKFYYLMLNKHIDLVYRRIILGEQIPHSEKVFSIFEAHTEWNSKGKAGKAVEFGHNVLVAFDQFGYILYGEVYEKMVDKSRTVALADSLKDNYGSCSVLKGISLDKNFFSLPAEKRLEQIFDVVVLPKAGRKSKRELAKEENEHYKKLKKAHPKVEGNINELEHHGLGMCRDKGIEGFKRYVAYGMLSHNLTKLGRAIIAQDQARIRRLEKRNRRQAA